MLIPFSAANLFFPMTTPAQFLRKILYDLHQSIYVLLGGSLEDETLNWAGRGITFLGIGIKILILLTIIGFFYWFLVYLLKHLRTPLHLSQRKLAILRSTLRYIWFTLSLLAVMTQIGIPAGVVKATAKASLWAGFYYVLWATSGQMMAKVLQYYELNASIEQLLKNMILVMIIVLALGTVLAQFGFDIVSLVAGLGIVGLAVGFAAQSTLANFIAGITILVEQSFQVGDWIRIGDKEGRVVKISLRATQILDRDNIIIIIPKMIRFSVKVRVALHADIVQARNAILGKLSKEEVVLKHPMPLVTVDELGEYALILTVRFWVAPLSVARIPIIKENLTERIKQSLDEAGIEIPYPYRKIILTDVDDESILTNKILSNQPIHENLEESLENAMKKT